MVKTKVRRHLPWTLRMHCQSRKPGDVRLESIGLAFLMVRFLESWTMHNWFCGVAWMMMMLLLLVVVMMMKLQQWQQHHRHVQGHPHQTSQIQSSIYIQILTTSSIPHDLRLRLRLRLRLLPLLLLLLLLLLGISTTTTTTATTTTATATTTTPPTTTTTTSTTTTTTTTTTIIPVKLPKSSYIGSLPLNFLW